MKIELAQSEQLEVESADYTLSLNLLRRGKSTGQITLHLSQDSWQEQLIQSTYLPLATIDGKLFKYSHTSLVWRLLDADRLVMREWASLESGQALIEIFELLNLPAQEVRKRLQLETVVGGHWI